MQSSDDPWPQRVAVLGVGLLGGSVAMSIRRRSPSTQFIGYSRTKATVDAAVGTGVIDEATDSIENACRDCDVIVVATPVDRIAAVAIEAARHSPDVCLITDVGSTKAGIVAAIEADKAATAKFIAAHPIAGSEKSGCGHAVETLFDGKVVVVTPSDSTLPEKIEAAKTFWSMTGANVLTMTPQQHDSHLAAVSHVPHLMSSLIARMVPDAARPLVGSGWQDITRVAAGDPEMWLAICQENRAAIDDELTRLASELDQMRGLVSTNDDANLLQWLAEAKRSKEGS